MKIRVLLSAAVLSLFSSTSVFASDFGLPQSPESVTVPEPAAPSAAPLLSEYAEYYSALVSYSNKAFAANQDSPEFYEAQAYGVYLRGRVEKLSAAIKLISPSDYMELCAVSGSCQDSSLNKTVRGEVSKKVSAELAEVFRVASAEKQQQENTPIKPGYCHIKYVKNGVPFLVQSDSFLKKGEVILTFDDGPAEFTEEVSASMKAGGAESLFFVLGRNLDKEGKKRIKAEAADGHQVAVHGYYHATEQDKPFTDYPTETILSQVGKVSGMISGVTGAKPAYFRPPYGIITADALLAVASDLDLVPVGWTIDTLDWSTKDPEALYANTISMIQKRGKGIVLMHDIHPQSRTAAANLVKWLAENGYKVVSPDRLAQAYKRK